MREWRANQPENSADTVSLRGLRRRWRWCMSGGGASGIVQVPFIEELIRRGIDRLDCDRRGAVNGAFLAFSADDIEGARGALDCVLGHRLWHRNILRITRNLLTRGHVV